MKTTLRLEVTDGEQTTPFIFDTFPIRIGRDPTNECQLKVASVSRRHARIELSDGALILHDEGSSHGVYVGGVRLEPNESVDLAIVGNEFSIGSLLLRAAFIVSNAPPPPYDEDVETADATRHYDELRIDPKVEDAHAIVLQARAASERHREAWEDIRRLLAGSLRTLDVDRRAEVIRHLAVEFPLLEREDEFVRAALECGVEFETSGVRNGAADLALRGLRELAADYLPFSPPLSEPGHVLTFVERLDDALRVLLDAFASLQFAFRYELGEHRAPQPNGGELAETLLDWTRECRPAVIEVEAAAIAMIANHVRVMDETSDAIEKVLRDLSPDEIERVTPRGLFGAPRWRALWRAYRYRHERLVVIGGATLNAESAALTEEASDCAFDEAEAPTWVQPRARLGSTMLSTV